MATTLLVDPFTERVVYVSRNGVVPERILILEGGKQHLFSPSSCLQVHYAGAVPDGCYAQKCWDFKYRANNIVPAEEEVSSQAA